MKESVARDAEPPEGLGPELKAMWFAKKGKWEAAHEIAQEIKTEAGSWIHAHLHVIEGDLWNAAYWYGKAGRAESSPERLAEEWEEIVLELLGA
jgi:hypothetical protein